MPLQRKKCSIWSRLSKRRPDSPHNLPTNDKSCFSGARGKFLNRNSVITEAYEATGNAFAILTMREIINGKGALSPALGGGLSSRVNPG